MSIINMLLENHWDTLKEQNAIKFINDNPNCINCVSDITKISPLMIASREGMLKIVNVLITLNANIDQTNKFGDTALMMASSEGRLDVVLRLLKCGANVNIANNVGNTALIFAAHDIHTNVVQALISNGGLINHTNEKGLKAIDFALKIIDSGKLINLLL